MCLWMHALSVTLSRFVVMLMYCSSLPPSHPLSHPLTSLSPSLPPSPLPPTLSPPSYPLPSLSPYQVEQWTCQRTTSPLMSVSCLGSRELVVVLVQMAESMEVLTSPEL